MDLATRKLGIGSKGIAPFHWEIEFPEVFTTDGKGNVSCGFDAIVGNPPFAGKNTLISAHADGYVPWLQMIHAESHGNSDLVAHFFRLAFDLLRQGGCFGLIATKTIGQGDTRSTGLRWICEHGGTIYRARKRLKWPGEAAVIVSVVHVIKGSSEIPFLLDNREVGTITAYLFHAGGHQDPATLQANLAKSFQGTVVLGMGFTFDDTDKKGVASSLSEMRDLIKKDPRNAERIFPYIGGEEVNNSPSLSHHRYVINFENFPLRRAELDGRWVGASDQRRAEWLKTHIVPLDYPSPVAEDWPDLLAIVEQRVRPERLKQASIVNPERWWMFARSSADLKEAIRGLSRVLVVNCGATPHMSFCFLSTEHVFANTLAVVALDTLRSFSVLQSRPHEIWARFMASSMKDDLRYTPSDCFNTFPFPTDSSDACLETAGRIYYDFRHDLMQLHNEGLTTIYNWFHDPNSDIPEMPEMRRLHDEMDRAVLDAYGWGEIQPTCDFFPEFDDEDENDETVNAKKTKYRYRWPDEVRDEVLARLLELNRQRALEEGQVVADETVAALAARLKASNRRPKGKQDSTSSLFATEQGEA